MLNRLSMEEQHLGTQKVAFIVLAKNSLCAWARHDVDSLIIASAEVALAMVIRPPLRIYCLWLVEKFDDKFALDLDSSRSINWCSLFMNYLRDR